MQMLGTWATEIEILATAKCFRRGHFYILSKKVAMTCLHQRVQ